MKFGGTQCYRKKINLFLHLLLSSSQTKACSCIQCDFSRVDWVQSDGTYEMFSFQTTDQVLF